MWELTKRILLRISSVLSQGEPEPDLYSGSDKKVPAPTGSGSATLYKCILFSEKGGSWLQRKRDMFGLGIAIFFFSSEVEHFLHQYSVGPL